MNKTTLILGATPNPTRYAYAAAERLVRHGHEIIPVGIKRGEVQGQDIINGRPHVENLDTVTLYIGAQHQPEYYDWLMELAPKRIIFNPGTENPELWRRAQEKGIETVSGCTLVMLAAGNY